MKTWRVSKNVQDMVKTYSSPSSDSSRFDRRLIVFFLVVCLRLSPLELLRWLVGCEDGDAEGVLLFTGEGGLSSPEDSSPPASARSSASNLSAMVDVNVPTPRSGRNPVKRQRSGVNLSFYTSKMSNLIGKGLCRRLS